MQCFHILVHGSLDWKVALSGEGTFQPRGFYCHRYVLAINQLRATEIAIERVRLNLNEYCNWVSNGNAVLELDAEEVRAAPWYKLLKRDDQGHTFYEQE